MNKYADFSNRLNFKSQVQFPCLTEGRVNSPKLDFIRSKVLSPRFDSDRKNFSGISGMASTQNMKLNSFSDRLVTEDSLVRFPEINAKGVKEKDFKNLLDKLDQVISPKAGCPEIIISEGASHEYSISSDSVQSFKISSKGKKCPLSVKIKIIYGAILSTVSLTDIHRVPKSGYKSSRSHFHELFDIKSEFQCEFVFIVVKAQTNSLVRIFSEFGKNQFLSNYKAYDYSVVEDDSIDKVISQPKSSKKNFIRVNMAVKVSKAEEMVSRVDNWKSKRDLIVKRKKLNEKAKKKKLINIMTKRIEKLEEVALCQERANKKQMLLKLCKEWLSIIYKIKSATSIYTLIRIKRADFFQKIRKNQKVHLIQQFYKTNLQPRTNSKVTANNTLLLFRNLTLIFHKKQTTKKICSVLSITAYTNLLFHMFTSYTEKMILIQKCYRRYCKKKNFRLATLRTKWNKCIEKSLYTKKGSARKRESLKFISIPSNIRDKVLKDFYYERWKAFQKEVAAYTKINGAAGAFVNLPIFTYIPSDVIMEGIIRNVVTKPRVK